MKKLRKDFYIKEAKILKALAHPTRLLILNMIKDRDVCVCELQKASGDDISTISKHLSVLKNAGLVNITRKGKWIYYKLACPCILDFLKCVREIGK